MNDEFIVFNDENDVETSHQESADINDNYMEFDIDVLETAVDMHAMMVQEGCEFEDLSYDDIVTYIESAIVAFIENAQVVQEADGEEVFIDPRVVKAAKVYKHNKENPSKVAFIDPEAVVAMNNVAKSKATKEQLKRLIGPYIKEKLKDPNIKTYSIDDLDDGDDVKETCSVVKEADETVDDSMVDDPNIIKNKKRDDDFMESYELKNTYQEEFDLEAGETLTAYEFFDESYEPDDDPLVYESEEIYTQEFTIAGAILAGTALGTALGMGVNILDQFITGRKYGRFPKDMKKVYQIIQAENFEASENKRALKKALRKLDTDLAWMLGGVGSRWKITVNEADELKKLKKHVEDLYTRGLMLTRIKKLSDKRRVPERLEDFVTQGNKVLEMLNKSIYKGNNTDAVTEYMV